MRRTNLCIPKALFLWLVHVNMLKMSDVYSTVHTPFLSFLLTMSDICSLYYFFSRLVRKITFRESKRLADKDREPEDYTDTELAEGKRNKCPLR